LSIIVSTGVKTHDKTKRGTVMNRNNNLNSMVTSALLCAVGIVIPIISPIKITMEPASFTLASHVAIFIAMFISPGTAAFVAAGTAAGFLLAGFPIVVVLRAASHMVFALLGSLYLKKFPNTLDEFKSSQIFSFMLALLHGLCEALIVIPFYFGNSMSAGYYAKGFIESVVLLVGVGTLIHSMVDFYLAQVIWKSVSRTIKIGTAINSN
jgi:niacin transporter